MRLIDGKKQAMKEALCVRTKKNPRFDEVPFEEYLQKEHEKGGNHR